MPTHKNDFFDVKSRHTAHWLKRKRAFGQTMRDVILEKAFHTVLTEPKMKALDLGCGDGIVAEYMENQGVSVYGADFSPEALKQAKKRGIKNLAQFDFNQEKFPYKSNTFDVVTWNDNAEHLLEPGFALKEIYRVLKPGGKVIITVPNMGFWWYRLYYILKGNVIGTDGIRPNGYMNQPWEWEHVRFFNKFYLHKFIEHFGFTPIYFDACAHNPKTHFLVKLSPQLFSQELLIVGEK